jgi:hypothetical protein
MSPKYSTDLTMNAALQDDAAMLESMGQDAGPTLDDFNFDDDYDWASPSDMGAQ